MSDPASKPALRAAVRATLADLSPDRARDASAALCLALATDPVFTRARTVMIFLPQRPVDPDAKGGGEPDLSDLARAALAAGKRVALPDIDWAAKQLIPRQIDSLDADVTLGRHRIPVSKPSQPAIDPAQLDLICVPGVAFSPTTGSRLGRGGGFYDRFLGTLPPIKGDQASSGRVLVGVCFACQLITGVPAEGHDVPIDMVATEQGVLHIPADTSGH